MSGWVPFTAPALRSWRRVSAFAVALGVGAGSPGFAQVTTKGGGPLAPPPLSTAAMSALSRPTVGTVPMAAPQQLSAGVPQRPAVLPPAADKPPAAPPQLHAAVPLRPVTLPPAAEKTVDGPKAPTKLEPVMYQEPATTPPPPAAPPATVAAVADAPVTTALPTRLPQPADLVVDPPTRTALQPVPMPLPGGAGQPDKAKVVDPPKADEKLPPPRPAFPDDRPRLSRLGGPLGTTPVPTDKDLEEFRQFIEGVIDPKNTLDVIEGRARLLMLKDVPTQFQLVDPTVVAANQLNDPKQFSVLGKKVGTTVLNLWFLDPADPAKKKEKIISYLVRVLPDPEAKARLERLYKALEEEINKAFPNSRVRLTLVGDKLMVAGQAHDVYDATQIMRIVRANAPGGGGNLNQIQRPAVTAARASVPNPLDPTNPTGTPGQDAYLLEGGPNVINNLRIPGEQQVMLRVTVAEVNRSAARSIGVNFALNIGTNGQQVFAQLTGGLLGTGLTKIGGGNLPVALDNGQIPIAINALRTLNYARTLAEPNLTTLNGQTATFLAGGQFPVPVLGGVGQFGTGGIGGGFGGGLQGVQFVPFGVQLFFTPYITDRDRIRLTVSSTVSTRNEGNGANIGGANVPGLNARTFTTTVEMREGQTMAVAGLIQSNLGADSQRVPFFGDLPYLGRLFGLDRITNGEQELVVLITPELVHPLNQNELTPLPGSDVFEPGDLEFYLKGRLESRRSYDYRSAVRTDIHRMLSYRKCEQQFITGPTGHMEGVFNRPLTAPSTGK
jgi:pilus assembly protein CpaC